MPWYLGPWEFQVLIWNFRFSPNQSQCKPSLYQFPSLHKTNEHGVISQNLKRKDLAPPIGPSPQKYGELVISFSFGPDPDNYQKAPSKITVPREQKVHDVENKVGECSSVGFATSS